MSPLARRRVERSLLVLAILMVLVAIVAPFAIRLLLPPPLEYRGLPWPVLNSPVRAGAPLHVRLEVCNHDLGDLPFAYTRALVRQGDHLLVALSPGSFTAPPGCTTVDSEFSVMPATVEPGTYVLRGVSTARGTWLVVDVPWETEPFEILP